MLALDFPISPLELWHSMATPRAPQIIDVRRRDIYESNPGLLPGSIWHEPAQHAQWTVDSNARSHEGERCSFDILLRMFGHESEPSLARRAWIVRGADTARPDLAPEAAGLHAVALGRSTLAGDDDHGLLQQGFAIYDALFGWLRFASNERHNRPVKAA